MLRIWTDSTTNTPSHSTQPLLIRLAGQDELPRCSALIRQYHSLGFERIVGSALYSVATVGDQWVALLGWGSAALKCGPRDQWIGWGQHLHERHLYLVANNVRFLMFPDCHQPNLASRILVINLKRLSNDCMGPSIDAMVTPSCLLKPLLTALDSGGPVTGLPDGKRLGAPGDFPGEAFNANLN